MKKNIAVLFSMFLVGFLALASGATGDNFAEEMMDKGIRSPENPGHVNPGSTPVFSSNTESNTDQFAEEMIDKGIRSPENPIHVEAVKNTVSSTTSESDTDLFAEERKNKGISGDSE